MDLSCYIAMTAAEFRSATSLPDKAAWLSCHFSPRSRGLSNLPENLPGGSVLIVDDSYVPEEHDPALVAQQLADAASRFALNAVILDFQIPGMPKTKEMVTHLVKALPCPVCVAAPYAKSLNCPVLIPPPPLHVSPAKHFDAWRGREIWLESVPEAQKITVTEQGSTISAIPYLPPQKDFFTDEKLCCKYQTKIYDDRVEFTLVRDPEMVRNLLEQCKTFGIRHSVGLYQQQIFP